MCSENNELEYSEYSSPQLLCDNERGAAMILVLVMLVLVMLLGSTLLSSSTTDLQIAGNYRNNQAVFYSNDYAYEYLKSAESIGSIYDMIDKSGTPTTLSPPANLGADIKYTATYLGKKIATQPQHGSGSSSEVGIVATSEDKGANMGAMGGSNNTTESEIYVIEITAKGKGSNNAVATTMVGTKLQQ